MKACKAIMAIVLGSTPVVALSAEAGGAQANPAGQWLMLLGFAFIFYFMIWRPQSQRQKAQAKMISELQSGDEIVTSGGVLGKITNIMDSVITLEVSNGVEVRLQKQAVANILPKGTMASK